KRFAKENGVPLLECGMLIVASFGDLPHLITRAKTFMKIAKNGIDQKIPLSIIPPWGLRKVEPFVRGIGGLLLPEVSVVDGRVFTEKLISLSEALGVEVKYDSPVRGISKEGGLYRVFTDSFEFAFDALVNAAGLSAHRVAALAGFADYRVKFFRGEYYEILGAHAKLVNRLVYPLPVEGRATKGVHLLKRPDGRLFIGCNSVEVPADDYYEEEKTPEGFFREAAARFVPSFRDAELQWSFSGIRPKIAVAGGAEPDFAFDVSSVEPFFMNCIGYDSPGLSSALAAGEYVAERINRLV
ncbi:MAG: FAD-dependent oxidoreductase, partial [Patescibacteria group bacterium]